MTSNKEETLVTKPGYFQRWTNLLNVKSINIKKANEIVLRRVSRRHNFFTAFEYPEKKHQEPGIPNMENYDIMWKKKHLNPNMPANVHSEIVRNKRLSNTEI